MKRTLILVYSAVLILILVNYFYYKNLYNKQIKNIVDLLDREVQVVGLSVDSTNADFISELSQISLSEDLSLFFTNPDNEFRVKERMKLFFSKYQGFITGIKMYDNNRNEFTLKKDIEKSGDWLEQTFILHVQPEIFTQEKMIVQNRLFDYYMPVLNKVNNQVTANIIITVDYQKYFSDIFYAYQLKDYQWQWVITDSGKVIYDNSLKKIDYSVPGKTAAGFTGSSIGSVIHKAGIDGTDRVLISSYYYTQLLQREFSLVFSSQTDFFHQYIIGNSLFIVFGTLVIIQVIIFIFWYYNKSQKLEINRLRESEKMLYKLIEEIPVGVIIHNQNREILKANKVAAQQYSYLNEAEMTGKIFPETTLPEDVTYFTKNFGPQFNPDKFIILKKEIGEIVLYRSSIPIFFMGEEADMEILIDVTMLESARAQEAKSSVAKSEFLSRMSYEIRTPLNGIIGMIDVLGKYNLSSDVREILSLLNRSTEVLLNIINDILDFSRIESGRMILDEVPFNLRDEIRYCTDLAKTNISGSEKDINLICTIDDDVPESIIGDPFRLRQVLINLLNHSVANTDTGEIRVNCMVKGRVNGKIVLGFDLRDTGKNFDKASLKKIFGDFVNIDSKAVTRDDSGFRTILSKQLVELMGGELTAESPSGISGLSGTKMTFTINTYSNDRPVKESSHKNIKSLDEIKTLVITGNQYRDDETLGVLHKMGLNVTITTFIKSTVSHISANLNSPENRYNLIIIFDDKDIDGFEPATAIWENNLSASYVILMISSNDNRGNYMKCINLGIDYYLVKPFDSNELLGILKKSFPDMDDISSTIVTGNVRNDIKILIVEDNKMNQKIIGTMLHSMGYNFDLVDDGYAGYIQAKNKKFDLIFMDLIMPEMDGFESAQKILSTDKSVLIVAFTADNMPESKRKAELVGIKDFISKPVRIEDLKNLFARYFK